MKLLFDQNISFRIVGRLNKYFPDSKLVREIGLEGKTDRVIWEFAKKNKFIIVSFDSDFFDFSNLFGFPPKLIWLRLGNTTTNGIADLLINKKEIINTFYLDKELACLEIE